MANKKKKTKGKKRNPNRTFSTQKDIEKKHKKADKTTTTARVITVFLAVILIVAILTGLLGSIV